MIQSFRPIRRDLSLSASPFLRWLHATLRHVVEDSFEMRRRLKLHPNIWSTRVFREGPLEELFYDGRTLQALDDILMGETLSTSNITFVLFAYTYRHMYYISFLFFRFVCGKFLKVPYFSPAILKNPCFKVWLACTIPILARWTKRCDSNVQNGGSRLPRAAASSLKKKCLNLCSPLHCEILGLGAIVSRFLI